jgi:hypothetical protein
MTFNFRLFLVVVLLAFCCVGVFARGFTPLPDPPVSVPAEEFDFTKELLTLNSTTQKLAILVIGVGIGVASVIAILKGFVDGYRT